MEFQLVPNQSDKGYYSRNLVCFNQIRKRFIGIRTALQAIDSGGRRGWGGEEVERLSIQSPKKNFDQFGYTRKFKNC